MRVFLAILSLAVAAASAPTFVSVCGDPGMTLPPKILLEGWNFCNRCGRSCSEAPRWADCVGSDGAQRVTPAANAAGLPLAAQSQPACDAFTEQKERDLGGLCADTVNNGTSFFWTAMFKSGAMNVSERGLLCGLWCANKTPDCNAAAADVSPRAIDGPASWAADNWTDTNYIMRQPRVMHDWTAPDGAGGFSGAFYGTLDEQADLSALPTPAELINQVLAPPVPGCSLDGSWLGDGNARLVITVAQAAGVAAFTADCTWPPGTPGLPAPWHAAGVVKNMSVTVHLPGHDDVGVAIAGEGRSADLICFSASSYWCRDVACDGGAAARCAAALAAKAAPISSYFGMAWETREGRRVHRHVLRAGDDLNWLMLYTGPEAAKGLKGGYEWDGRGQYATIPLSTTRNASEWQPSWGKMPPNNFQVVQWTNITLWPGGPGFYFLNYGACWKDTGVECDGDITTDVTRYLLFQLPSADADQTKRCGPGAAQRALCPPYHRYRNGTVVTLEDTARFPFRAYHSVSTRVRGADGAFHCKHDCWSNPCVCVRALTSGAPTRPRNRPPSSSCPLIAPAQCATDRPSFSSRSCDQDWVRIEPSPEWAEYGFPDTVSAAMTPTKWTLDAGAVSAAMSVHFSGNTPPLLAWTTLNMGPEMMGGPGTVAVWELAESDVLIEAGSQ